MIWYLNRLHAMLSLNRQDQFLDTSLPKKGRLFLYQTVDAVVTRHAKLRRLYPDLQDKVFHSARKWFITCLAPYTRPLIFGFSNKVSGTGGRMFNA
jgi:hypothetical protein